MKKKAVGILLNFKKENDFVFKNLVFNNPSKKQNCFLSKS